jgi:S-adenosylmethionine:tRNA-ribosyltransferase-isomerase (queuine synthetase)
MLNFKLKIMRATRIVYSRLISKGNFENAKIEIELEVEKGEKANDVLEKARIFIDKHIQLEKLSGHTLEMAKRVMEDKRNHTLAQIEEAEAIIAKSKIEDDGSLPF